jgi:hypothetical protein
VTSLDDLPRLLTGNRIGAVVTLGILRGADRWDARVTVAARRGASGWSAAFDAMVLPAHPELVEGRVVLTCVDPRGWQLRSRGGCAWPTKRPECESRFCGLNPENRLMPLRPSEAEASSCPPPSRPHPCRPSR